MRALYFPAIASVLGLVATQASAEESSTDSALSLAASVGIDYSTGAYGAEEKTDVVLVPVILRARSGKLALSSSVTYIRIDGPADIVIGPDGEQLPGVPTGSGVREGLSDLSLGAGYTISGKGAVDPQFAVSGRIKLPTSRESVQLSTGKVDYSVRGEVTVPAGGISPFASVGYRFLGDPEGVDLRNGLTASVGASAAFGRKVVIASFDYSTATSASTEDSRSLFGGFSIPVSSRMNMTGYGVVGLSESTPDYGLGLLLTAQVL